MDRLASEWHLRHVHVFVYVRGVRVRVASVLCVCACASVGIQTHAPALTHARHCELVEGIERHKCAERGYQGHRLGHFEV